MDGCFWRGDELFVAAEVEEVVWQDGGLMTSRRSQHIKWEVFEKLKGAENARNEMGTMKWLEMSLECRPGPKPKSTISIVCMLLSQYIAPCFGRREKASKVSLHGDCHGWSSPLAPQRDEEHATSAQGTTQERAFTM
jgi:hypothetical protein